MTDEHMLKHLFINYIKDINCYFVLIGLRKIIEEELNKQFGYESNIPNLLAGKIVNRIDDQIKRVTK